MSFIIKAAKAIINARASYTDNGPTSFHRGVANRLPLWQRPVMILYYFITLSNLAVNAMTSPRVIGSLSRCSLTVTPFLGTASLPVPSAALQQPVCLSQKMSLAGLKVKKATTGDFSNLISDIDIAFSRMFGGVAKQECIVRPLT